MGVALTNHRFQHGIDPAPPNQDHVKLNSGLSGNWALVSGGDTVGLYDRRSPGLILMGSSMICLEGVPF